MKTIWTGNKESRPLCEIAQDIFQYWPKMYFGAVPYAKTMLELNSISDTYYADTAKDIVIYFLSNAATWRGEKAREIKAELRDILKQAK